MIYKIVVTDKDVLNTDPGHDAWLDGLISGTDTRNRQVDIDGAVGYLYVTTNPIVAGALTAVVRGEITKFRAMHTLQEAMKQ